MWKQFKTNTHLTALMLSALFMVYPTFAFVNNNYTISPLISELELGKPGEVSTMVLDVVNEKDVKIKIQVRPTMWTLNDTGGLVYLDTPEGFDFRKDVMINPREFEVEPFQRKPIRFGIRRPASLPDGEYRFQLAFEEVKLMPDFTQTFKKNGITAVINTKTVLASTIYVHAGTDNAPAVKAEHFQCQVSPERELSASVDVRNDGTKHGRLLGVVVLSKRDATGAYLPQKQVDVNNGGVIVLLPHKQRSVAAELVSKEEAGKLPAGQYRAELTLMDEREVQPAVTQQCDVTVN